MPQERSIPRATPREVLLPKEKSVTIISHYVESMTQPLFRFMAPAPCEFIKVIVNWEGKPDDSFNLVIKLDRGQDKSEYVRAIAAGDNELRFDNVPSLNAGDKVTIEGLDWPDGAVWMSILVRT